MNISTPKTVCKIFFEKIKRSNNVGQELKILKSANA